MIVMCQDHEASNVLFLTQVVGGWASWGKVQSTHEARPAQHLGYSKVAGVMLSPNK
jgi:nitrate/TMAO reductase-like tetraheme cytochrome c subunit